MRPRFVVLAAISVAFASRAPAFADDAVAARALFKKGIEEYKAQKYGDASITLLKSYELDPKPDTLFALAQAERLDGRCSDAVGRYKKLLEDTKDLPTAKAIGANIMLCVSDKPVEAAPEKKPEPVVQTQPQTITKTVVKTERTTDKLSVALFSGGALALGGSVGLYFASRSSSADSDRATTLEESNRLYDRSKREQLLSFAVAGAGAALITVGIVHVVRKGPKSSTEVAAVPASGGATFWVSSRW